jgi:hypothetical protein
MVTSTRDKLSNRHGSSVFPHVLESGGRSQQEETHERNFRDLRQRFLSASQYVHKLIEIGEDELEEDNKFFIYEHIHHLPEAGNEEEEDLLGIHSPDFYKDVNLFDFSEEEVLNGDHLMFNQAYEDHINTPPTAERSTLIFLGQFLQNLLEDWRESL